MADVKVIDDGGPAFPVGWPLPNAPEPGMSLRDWFAGQALCHIGSVVAERMRQGKDPFSSAHVAEICYEVADAMLRVRK